ncbi:MAG: amino acid ABC transporter permease, partial [Mesorhizobium sp.]
MYTFDFGAVLDRAPELLWGSLGTVGLALAGMLLALVIGLLGVVARSSKSGITRAAVIMFVEVVRNTPFLVQIFFIYFALPLMGIRLNPTVTAIIALGINGGAYA